MLKPLAAGLHDFRTAFTVSGVINKSLEHHFQINVFHVNHPPAADASATQSHVISPNNHNAKVVLDGSRSSDPDNDPLSYAWLVDGSPIASGVMATNILPVGSHIISLVVNDGTLSGTNTITLDVITACEALAELASGLDGAQLSHKKLNPLVDELQDACSDFTDAFQHGHHESDQQIKRGIRELREFQGEIERDHLDQPLAGALIAGAQEIIDAVGWPRHHEHGDEDHEDDND
jgi:hypothetical protein